MGKRVAEKGKPSCYDKAPHCAAVQTHEDRPKEPSSRICPTRKESDGFFQAGCPPENRFVLLARGGQRERAMRNKSQPCRQSGTLAAVFRVCLRCHWRFGSGGIGFPLIFLHSRRLVRHFRKDGQPAAIGLLQKIAREGLFHTHRWRPVAC